MSAATCRDKECKTYVDNGDGTYSQQVTMTSGGASSTDVPIIQCLQDDTGTTFFATYLIDPATGLPSVAPVYMDTAGAAYVPTGAIVKPKNPLDTEVKLFCDAGNADEKFLKVIVFAEDGSIQAVSDTDLTGAAYVPVGPVEVCEGEIPPECELTEVWVCDSTDAVNGVEEQEWIASAITGEVDLDIHQVAAGFRSVNGCGQLYHENAADAVNIITNSATTNVSNGAAADQHELNFYVKFDEPTPLAARLRGNSGGIIYMGSCFGKTQKIFEDYRPFGSIKPQVIPIGTYPAGIYKVRVLSQDPTDNGQAGLWSDDNGDGSYNVIPAAQLFTVPPKVEKKKAWVNKGEERFFNLDGTEILEDAVTEIKCYDPCVAFADAPAEFDQVQCEFEKIYLVDTTGATGATEQYWEVNATDPGNTRINTAFTLADSCGVVLHENAPDTELVITVDGALTTDNPAGAVAHQSRVEGYIVIPQGGKEIQLTQGGLASSALYMGACYGKLAPVAEQDSASGSDQAGYFAGGVYHFVLFLHDDGTNGNARVRWRDAGAGGYVDVPLASIFVDMPVIERVPVWVEKGKSAAQGLDGVSYDLGAETTFLCDPCDNTVDARVELQAADAPAADKAAATIVGDQRIVVANGTAASLTVPAAANGAVVQVQYADKDADEANCVRYYFDGRTATATRGFLANNKQIIYLGCAASNEATITDPAQELADFSFHTGELTDDAILEVTYYAY